MATRSTSLVTYRDSSLPPLIGDPPFTVAGPGSLKLARTNRACAERILTTVFVEKHAPHRPEEIVLHSPPRPFVH